MSENTDPVDLETFWAEYMAISTVWTQEKLARRAFASGYELAMWEQRA